MFGFKINVDLQDRSLWYTAFKHDIEASVFPFLSYMLVIVRMSHAYEIPLYIAMHSTGWYKTTILSRRKKKSKETKNARHRTWQKPSRQMLKNCLSSLIHIKWVPLNGLSNCYHIIVKIRKNKRKKGTIYMIMWLLDYNKTDNIQRGQPPR